MICRAAFLLLLLTTAAAADGSVSYPSTAYVYATSSGILRRITIPGPGETVSVPYDANHETFVVQSSGAATDQPTIEAAIAIAIGKPIAVSRCAVIVGGNALNIGGTVGNIRQCDPTLDGVAGQHLVASLIAQIGDGWDGTHLTRSFAICNPLTKVVDELATLNIDNPISPITGDLVVAAGTLTVGSPCIAPKVIQAQ